jgi:cytochrome c biogenesis protein CcmG, thiol:disulfide interchange protein DsbE
MRLLACLTAAFLFAATATAADLSKLKRWEGGATPPLALKDLSGKDNGLAQQRGKAVLINFWATWCAPCVKEMPALQKLADNLADERFALLTVNFGEGEGRIEPFLKRLELRLPVLLDRDMDTTKGWGVRGLPATFLLDANHRVRYQVLGELEWDHPAVEQKIRELLP